MALLKLCPICGKKIAYSSKYCDNCLDKQSERKADSNRYYDKSVRKTESNNKYDSFYHSREWLRARMVAVARDKGLCVDCLSKGLITPYHTVHHKVAIKNDWNKRLDINNLVALCESCHQKRHENMKNGGGGGLKSF